MSRCAVSAASRLLCLIVISQAIVFGQSPSSITLVSSPNPATYGQPVTLTATVTSGATGKVTFFDGVSVLGVGTMAGTQATLTTVLLMRIRTGDSGRRTYPHPAADAKSSAWSRTSCAGSRDISAM